MARPIRINIRGGIYHVTARGNNRQVIFHDDRDAAHFEELLEETAERFRVKILAYVVMGNHYHVMVQTPEANCSEALWRIQIEGVGQEGRGRGLHGHLHGPETT